VSVRQYRQRSRADRGAAEMHQSDGKWRGDGLFVVIFAVEQIAVVFGLSTIFLTRTTACSVVVFHGAIVFFAAVLPHTGFFNAVAAIVWKGKVVSHESTRTAITLSLVTD
jgi:hypothetical protein